MSKLLATVLVALTLLTSCQTMENRWRGHPCPDTTATPRDTVVVPPADPAALKIVGTEPFWMVWADETAIVWFDPERQDGVWFPSVTATAEGDEKVYRAANKDGQRIEIRITEKPCSDGMSDRTYGIAVVVRFERQTFHGCGWWDADDQPIRGTN